MISIIMMMMMIFVIITMCIAKILCSLWTLLQRASFSSLLGRFFKDHRLHWSLTRLKHISLSCQFPPISNLLAQVPQDKLAALLEAFGRLKEKVLFKWETDNLPGICIIDNPPECLREQFCFFARQACQCAAQEFPSPTGAGRLKNTSHKSFPKDLLALFLIFSCF